MDDERRDFQGDAAAIKQQVEGLLHPSVLGKVRVSVQTKSSGLTTIRLRSTIQEPTQKGAGQPDIAE